LALNDQNSQNGQNGYIVTGPRHNQMAPMAK